MSEFVYQVQSYVGAGGVLLVPIAVVCMGIWAYYLRSRFAMTGVLSVSRAQAADFLADMQEHGISERTALKYGSYRHQVPGAVEYVIRQADRGASPAQAFDTYESFFMQGHSRDIIILIALTAIAPLLGLLGTVAGMIGTFDAVAIAGGETAGQVAGGISQALITTQFGLLVAIPGVFGVAHLRRLEASIRTRLAFYRGQLMLAYEQVAV